jgi:diguanylate cyclase (GGDEF)-like protein
MDQEARQRAEFLLQAPGFLPALERRDRNRLSAHLEELRATWKLVSPNSGLVRLGLYEEARGFLTVVPPAAASAAEAVAPCAFLHAQAANELAPSERAPPPPRQVSTLCLRGGKLWHETLSPIAAAGRDGVWLHSVTDLQPMFARLESLLGLAFRLRLPDGRVLYRSTRWPEPAMGLDDADVVRYPLYAFTGAKSAPSIEVDIGMHELRARLDEARRLIVIVMLLVIVLVVAVAGWWLQRTTLAPLALLTRQLARVRQDRERLGERIPVPGTAELAALAEGFNEMSARLKTLYEQLSEQAFTDPLTGLPNRGLFLDRLQQAILSARRSREPFALLFMDLDRFKDVNDTLGHHVGDLLLKQVAARLREKLRASDTIARMGGDEFAILLPTVNGKHADMAARMLLQTLRAPFLIEEQSLTIGASIGVVLYPEHGVEANVLMQRADVAMYAAKAAGSGYAFYENRLDQHHPARLVLLSDLRHAVERQQFLLYYQPKVNLREGKVAGFEGLVRWRHPQSGLLLPERFIALMEQTGLIRSLTPWVLGEALRTSRRLAESGFASAVSVNLSMRDLQDPFLIETIVEQIEANQVSARWLELEITESAVMSEPARAIEVLTRLANLGLKLSIDDFGTGYSSLAYLKRLPVHAIKIDKTFVRGMTHDEDDAAIVRTSIELAHSLGMEVVAEGVENEDILARLRAMGCDLAQGHYLSRALTEAELDEWLAQSVWAAGAGVPLRSE